MSSEDPDDESGYVETFPCPRCDEDAIMDYYTTYFEHYECDNCGYSFKVN